MWGTGEIVLPSSLSSIARSLLQTILAARSPLLTGSLQLAIFNLELREVPGPLLVESVHLELPCRLKLEPQHDEERIKGSQLRPARVSGKEQRLWGLPSY